MNEQRWRYGWKLLCSVWEKNRHCLEYGCGRDTLQKWVKITCGVWLPAWFYREVLMEAVRRGKAEKLRSTSGHSIFILTPNLRRRSPPQNQTGATNEHEKTKGAALAWSGGLGLITEAELAEFLAFVRGEGRWSCFGQGLTSHPQATDSTDQQRIHDAMLVLEQRGEVRRHYVSPNGSVTWAPNDQADRRASGGTDEKFE